MKREQEWRWPADATAPRKARHAIAAFATGCDLDKAARSSIALVVTEAVTNAVLHAYRDGDRPDGEIVMRACCARGRIEIVVRDQGEGLRPRLDSPGLGLGLPLIAQFADESDIRSAPDGGTEVLVAFRLGSAAAHA